MESDIDNIIDTYAMFGKFDIVIPPVDYNRANSLKINYEEMMERSKHATKQIFNMQAPLLLELNTGIAAFREGLATFNDDYEQRGPMEPGLSAKDASDRVGLSLWFALVLT